jgi:hypothetical protein
VFTERYGLSAYIKQTLSVFKRLMYNFHHYDQDDRITFFLFVFK